MKKPYTVELEKGVWLADWDGDPGRTLNKNHAKRFKLMATARLYLRRARKFRPFSNAKIHKEGEQ